jgi:hypothetical protein
MPNISQLPRFRYTCLASLIVLAMGCALKALVTVTKAGLVRISNLFSVFSFQFSVLFFCFFASKFLFHVLFSRLIGVNLLSWNAGNDCSLGDVDFKLEVVESAGHDLTEGDVVHVSFTRPAGNNTDFDFIGVYGSQSANSSDQLFAYVYAVASESSEGQPDVKGSVDVQLPTDGEMVVRYVNAYTLATEVETNSFIVYPTCPSSCSSHGSCVKGACVCDAKWRGDDCSKDVGLIQLSPASGPVVNLNLQQLGFEVRVKRPSNHYNTGDFIALFPEKAPTESSENKGFTYAKAQVW